jgi:hypothetical protein
MKCSQVKMLDNVCVDSLITRALALLMKRKRLRELVCESGCRGIDRNSLFGKRLYFAPQNLSALDDVCCRSLKYWEFLETSKVRHSGLSMETPFGAPE